MRLASLVTFPKHVDPNGALCVYESGKAVPFDIKRVFTVTARANDVRGDHAHKLCSQLLVCLAGTILVSCDNGIAVEDFKLDNMGTGLMIPPGIWATQQYIEDHSVLMVLCDRGYEENDYIRVREEFIASINRI
ncbi:MAG: FdtA/QdtA family cupin domain-containing protein [Zoogloeaceae bacterium]|nr:FdtA/QdtA family cupin domain-containing protein [Zoogloeaceae bacterium]MCK6383185.1 FdtA/QdtA family cupin domain-containing protein [Rhodocyclaceae bacterium]